MHPAHGAEMFLALFLFSTTESWLAFSWHSVTKHCEELRSYLIANGGDADRFVVNKSTRGTNYLLAFVENFHFKPF